MTQNPEEIRIALAAVERISFLEAELMNTRYHNQELHIHLRKVELRMYALLSGTFGAIVALAVMSFK